jgi:hypothetical protein
LDLLQLVIANSGKDILNAMAFAHILEHIEFHGYGRPLAPLSMAEPGYTKAPLILSMSVSDTIIFVQAVR